MRLRQFRDVTDAEMAEMFAASADAVADIIGLRHALSEICKGRYLKLSLSHF
jgi:hypothetical protein